MEQNFDNKIDFKSKIINFYKKNKLKIQIFFIGVLILFFSILFLQTYNKKKNNEISEQFIKANILYATDEKDRSREIYEKILVSNNSFYSTLALNNIIEKDLENNDARILEYFDKVLKLQKNKEIKDIIKFKKALFLLKKSNNQEANSLLKELIESNSPMRDLAEEILVD